MKAKQLLAACLIGIQFLLPATIQAETLDDLDQKESEISAQSQSISAEIQTTLTTVNQKYQEVEEIKEKVADNQATIDETNEEIKISEDKIATHKERVAERLKDLQLNGAERNKWAILLETGSFTDFVNGIYALTTLQNAEKSAVADLQDETKRLQDLQEKAAASQAELTASQATLEAETQDLDSQITSLQDQLAQNATALDEIANSKVVEQARLKAEAEKAEAEKAAQEKAAKAQQVAVQETTEASTNSKDTSTEQTAPTSTDQNNNNTTETPSGSTESSGKVLYMESTAYSYAETGYSITASGLDLRQNPMAIAVDTSVIPLGTLVEVEGYGVAIAADTGGAIKGNTIDVHFKTVDECKAWGRKFNVKVTILD